MKKKQGSLTDSKLNFVFTIFLIIAIILTIVITQWFLHHWRSTSDFWTWRPARSESSSAIIEGFAQIGPSVSGLDFLFFSTFSPGFSVSYCPKMTSSRELSPENWLLSFEARGRSKQDSFYNTGIESLAPSITNGTLRALGSLNC